LSSEATFPSDVSEKTDSDSTVVTVVTRESSSVVDDVQSLFSVDQDGFFTSMHTDSGLAVQPMNNAAGLGAESSNSTDANSSRNTSVETKSFDMQSPASNESSDVVSVTALTAQLSSSFALPTIDNKLDVGNKTEIEHCGHKISRILAEKDIAFFRSPSIAQSVVGAFPSFCTVTPPSSEDEDAEDAIIDQTDCDWPRTCSTLSPSAAVSTPLPPTVMTSECGMSPDVSLLDSYTLPQAAKVRTVETNADSKFSTWPCSPVPGCGASVRGILKSKSDGTKCHQTQKFIKFSPIVSPGQEASNIYQQLLTQNSESYREMKASSSASSASIAFDQTQKIVVEDSNGRKTLLSRSDDSTLLTEQTLREGATLGEDKVDETSSSAASNLSTLDAGIPAEIVFSSPVMMQSTYVENTHRRLVCRPVRPDEWQKFTSYASKNHWSSTLPRNLRLLCRTSKKCGNERHHRRSNTEGSNVQLWQQSGVLLTDRTVCVAQQDEAIVPLTMFHSPRRYGIDGREESLQTIASSTVEHGGEPAVANYGKTAMAVKPSSAGLSRNMSDVRDRQQHSLSSLQTLKHSSNAPQLPSLSYEGRELQKPNAKLVSEVICENKNALSGENVIRFPCQSPVCQRVNSVDFGVIQMPTVELQTPESIPASFDFDHIDACAAVTSDVQAVDSDGMQTLDVKCSQPDFLQINSAAVYSISSDRDSIARSSESISSTLSAAERSRAAKLAFLGFSLAEDDDAPVVNPANVNHHNACIFSARTEDTSISCSSSGLGSSVSGSPVVSPDDNSLNVDANQTSAETACASCNGLVAKSDQQSVDCTVKYKATVPLTDRSKQTSV